MPQTSIVTVQDQVQKKWAPLFMKELRENLLLGSLINKQYQGAIGQEGDTVRVSQINAPAGALKAIDGSTEYTFTADAVSTSYVDVKADKRAVAAFEIHDTAMLMSQLDSHQSELRESLMFSVAKKINDYLFSLVAPSASAPDHIDLTVTDFNASVLQSQRLKAAKAKWSANPGWYALLSPEYYGDMLNAQTLTSADFVPDAPVVGGQIASKRFGFNILEDNSMSTDTALLFHPDFMHLVMQYEPRFKVSDLHPVGKFGMMISVDLVFGAKLGIEGAKKHMTVSDAAFTHA